MPRWTREEFIRYEQRRLARNRPPDNPRPVAILEPDPRVEPLAAPQIEASNPARFRVVVASIRRRLLDEDNLCEKFHVDCLRRAGYIPDDDPATTHIEVWQRKCQTGEAERIEIVIEKLNIEK